MATTATSTDALLAYPEAVVLAPVNQSQNRRSRASSDRPPSSAPSSDSGPRVDPSKGESYLIIVCVAVITGISMLLWINWSANAS
jgi:hypothetical protein